MCSLVWPKSFRYKPAMDLAIISSFIRHFVELYNIKRMESSRCWGHINCEYHDSSACSVVTICFDALNVLHLIFEMPQFVSSWWGSIWSNAFTVMGVLPFSTYDLVCDEWFAMYHPWHQTSRHSICVRMYIGRFRAYMASPYMRTRLTMVSNDHTFGTGLSEVFLVSLFFLHV